jgi:uncharacterized protein
MHHTLLWLAPLFFITAICYSMVGFGGGSTYLALLILAGVSYSHIPSISLLCNLVVVSSGCYLFIKHKQLNLRLVLPFFITSIPMAYLGGKMHIDKNTFVILLGFALLIAGMRMLWFRHRELKNHIPSKKMALMIGLPVGAALGFLSGITGIGGGIYLAPILYLLGWGSAKNIAAAASIFILVNSGFGLLGQLEKNLFVVDYSLLLPLAICVFLGGQIGSRLSAIKFNPFVIKRLTAILIIFVAVRVLWQSLL